MKQFVAITLLAFLGAGVWFIGSRLSSDAIGMALGVMFGVLAALPAALLVLASQRRSRADEDVVSVNSDRTAGYGFSGPPQPPVIIVTGPGLQQQGGAPAGYLAPEQQARLALPDFQGQKQGRPFRMVGEKDEWIEEF